ncbi:protein BTN1-like [Actinia tenebrosa]|uniref:Battenin n=1 Tax=Actinia tenebrosa TaxID=6105 RepID=A0A6P8HVA2_ACTTE|nr:protein BTN1-like [Actinia tenebrosa]
MAEQGDQITDLSKALLPIDNKKPESNRERPSTLVAFFVFGALIYAMYSLIIAGAQDILAGTYIQTSMVLVANIGPYVVVTFVAPYFMKNIPYFVRICFVFLTGAVGFIVIVCSKEVEWKLIGIGLASLGYGVGEVSFLALTSYFHSSALSAYSVGTGVGFVAAPLYYTAMTTWLCISPKVTMLIMAGMLLLLFVCYNIMDKKHLDTSTQPTTCEDVAYTKLPDQEPESESNETSPNTKASIFVERDSLTWKEKMSAMRTIFSLTLIPLFAAWLSEYLIIQSVLTTIAFTNASFRPRDHYQYYIFVFMLGEVFGRSYSAVVSYLKPSWISSPTWKQLWALSIIEILHLLFFIFESWYRFLPGVSVVLLLCLSAGVVIGMLFNCVLVFFRESFDQKHREFIMGYSVCAMGAGILTAALVGLYVEPLLRTHCISTFKDSGYCFTRSSTLKDVTSRCGGRFPAANATR